MPSSNSSKNRAVRLVWPAGAPKDINDLYLLHRDNFKAQFDKIVADSIAQARPGPLLEPFANYFEEVLAYLQRMAGDAWGGIPAGYSAFDLFTNGLQGIVLLGGPPKVGKSMFALSIAAYAAEQGYPVILLDFENGRRKIAVRLLSRFSGISNRDILLQSHQLTDSSSFDRIATQFRTIGQNLFVRRPSLTEVAAGNRADLESLQRLFESYVRCVREEIKNDRPPLIVIDSLQKLPLWSMADRRGNIDMWLRSFEWVREQLHATFLIVSELARGAYLTPTLESFKESGDVEYTADLALHLTTSTAEYNNTLLELRAVAHRDGEAGLIATYRPDYAHCRFLEVPNNDGLVREIVRR